MASELSMDRAVRWTKDRIKRESGKEERLKEEIEALKKMLSQKEKELKGLSSDRLEHIVVLRALEG